MPLWLNLFQTLKTSKSNFISNSTSAVTCSWLTATQDLFSLLSFTGCFQNLNACLISCVSCYQNAQAISTFGKQSARITRSTFISILEPIHLEWAVLWNTEITWWLHRDHTGVFFKIFLWLGLFVGFSGSLVFHGLLWFTVGVFIVVVTIPSVDHWDVCR